MKTGWALMVIMAFCFACNNEKPAASDGDSDGSGAGSVSQRFKELKLPYTLSDTALLNWKDTITIRSAEFDAKIPDSIKSKIFPKNAKLKYQPIGKIQATKNEAYFFVKASASGRQAALLMTYDKEGEYAATLPFLIPDNDPATNQISSVDKSLSISRSIWKKQSDDVTIEGKDVFIFNADGKQFLLIGTDALDDSKLELINPIDTLPKTNKFAGDYVKGKRNLVSIRDGRTPNQLMAFVHLENEEGCKGEVKGELLMTSATTAIFRQGGDPCVLRFQFTNNSVSLQEEQGCGNHRGLDCAFLGSYPKKKEPKPKAPKKGSRRP
jgi:hypothetical protein